MLTRALLLLALTLVAALPSWLRGDLDGTEGRRIQIGLEMLRSGDLLMPTLGGQPTWAKPPLHYWLIAAFAWVFGDGHAALRLPGVLALWATALVGGELVRAWFGPRAGWIAALGVACSPMGLFLWPTAEIDPLFAGLTSIGILLLATGVARERSGLVATSGFVSGLALLQKGPPFFLFAFGAYLVWWRHRRFAGAVWHFAPMLLMVSGYYGALFVLRVAPGEMLAVANDETVGRIAGLRWQHVLETPVFWVRAFLMQAPLGLWCFWEWRGARDARMDSRDLTLRMCSGGAVLAVSLLTFFPGRPTRYLLPNVSLFTFAVAPAVAHYFTHRAPLSHFVRTVLWVMGITGAVGLVVVPLVPRAGTAPLAFALAAALLPLLVRRPRHVVVAALVVPVLANWTIGLERSLGWPQNPRAQSAGGALLRRELDALGASSSLATHGHIESCALLATGLWPAGDEAMRRRPEARWLMRELDRNELAFPGYRPRLCVEFPYKTFVVFERDP